jgi:predicted aspartyl protease
VTPDREPTISVRVTGPDGQQQEIRALIDTGFDGFLTLPSGLIAALDLPWRRRGRAILADGAESVLAREILALPEPERQQLAREVLPALLATRAGLEEIDEALRDLSDDELRALVERARRRASDLSEDEVAAIIAEGLQAARAHGRP